MRGKRIIKRTAALVVWGVLLMVVCVTRSAAFTAGEPYSEKVTLKTNRTVNIRGGPGTSYPQVGEAYPGVSFYFTGIRENGFYRIIYPGANGEDVTAYVIESLADVSPVYPRDVILSSRMGEIHVQKNARVYLDATLTVRSKIKINETTSVSYAGVSSGAYAVLLNRVNDKGEDVLWIGFVSAKDVKDDIRSEKTDGGGLWRYIAEEGKVTITGYVGESVDNLVIPGELDGLPVTGLGRGEVVFCGGLTSVTIPDSVKTIGDSLFGDNETLTLTVTPGSAAERYADEYWIRYVYGEDSVLPPALVNPRFLTGMGAGAVLGVAQTPEGGLYAGTRNYAGNGWLTYTDRDGKVIWTSEKGDEKEYLYPTALPDGGFAVLRLPAIGGEDPRFCQDLVMVGTDGVIKQTWVYRAGIMDITALEDSLIVSGHFAENAERGSAGEAGTPFCALINFNGETLREIRLTDKNRDLRLVKAVYNSDYLIAGLNADRNGTDAGTAALMRCDWEGAAVWEKRYAPQFGTGAYLNDLCVDDRGTIAVLFTEREVDEDTGEPLRSRCYAAGLNMDGEELWMVSLHGEANHILPVKGGFLCVSRGLDMDNCPYLGDGWVLLLDRDGNVKAPENTPDIGGGLVEIYGAAPGGDGKILLFGSALAQQGAPGTPFYAVLDFPEAYR